jgi:hypothetical protein
MQDSDQSSKCSKLLGPVSAYFRETTPTTVSAQICKFDQIGANSAEGSIALRKFVGAVL